MLNKPKLWIAGGFTRSFKGAAGGFNANVKREKAVNRGRVNRPFQYRRTSYRAAAALEEL